MRLALAFGMLAAQHNRETLERAKGSVLIPTSKRLNWLRVLVEGVVIVGSILIAFVLEGWRDDRSMAGEMKQELVNVQRELLRNQDLIVAEVEGLDRIVSASHFLLNDMQTAKDAETIMASDTLAWLVTGWNPTLNVSLGGVSALIASGRLAQVENAELRAGLAGLKDDVDDVVEDEVQARLMNIQQLVPLLAEPLDMEATFGVGVGFLAARNSPGVTHVAGCQAPFYTYKGHRFLSQRSGYT